MASAWGSSWGSSWGNSWGAAAAVPPVVEAPPVRIYGSGGWGSSYRPRDEDIEDLMRLLDPEPRRTKRKRKKKPATAAQIEKAALALMQIAGQAPSAPVVRAVLGDSTQRILEMRRRHESSAALRMAIEAMLNAAADAAAADAALAAQIESDEEDVLLLLAAA